MNVKNDADLIVPGIWLGNSTASIDIEFLKANNIKTVFNCTKNLPFHSSIKRRYRVPVDDNLQAVEIRNLELWSYETVYKLTKERKEGHTILVHCAAGMQRSAAVLAMYLISTHAYKPDEAIQYIRQKRSIAFWPVANFKNAIQGFYDSYVKDIVPKLI